MGSVVKPGCVRNACVESTPSPIVATTSAKRLQGVERTDQNFVHSARTA
jgi:hypothetical protein